MPETPTAAELDEILSYRQFLIVGGIRAGKTDLLSRLQDRADVLDPPARQED